VLPNDNASGDNAGYPTPAAVCVIDIIPSQ